MFWPESLVNKPSFRLCIRPESSTRALEDDTNHLKVDFSRLLLINIGDFVIHSVKSPTIKTANIWVMIFTIFCNKTITFKQKLILRLA